MPQVKTKLELFREIHEELTRLKLCNPQLRDRLTIIIKLFLEYTSILQEGKS